MLRSIMGFDWKKSPAHLHLLTKFLSPQAMEDISRRKDTWESVLKESLEKAVRRFLDEKVLEYGGLAEILDVKYKASELKEMLKQRGLSTAGNKSDYITRLLQADPHGIE